MPYFHPVRNCSAIRYLVALLVFFWVLAVRLRRSTSAQTLFSFLRVVRGDVAIAAPVASLLQGTSRTELRSLQAAQQTE